jgi:hypothetical protein
LIECADNFAPEVSEAEVVTDVGVGQEDPVEKRGSAWRDRVERR